MDPGGVESRSEREASQDEKRPCARERTALRIQEEVGSMPPVEEGTAPGEVATERLGCGPAERHHAFLPALPEAPDEPAVEVDAAALQPDGLADAEAGPVEELDERLITERSGGRSARCSDQTLDLTGRERPREPASAPRQIDVRGRVVGTLTDQNEVAEERAAGGRASGDRARGLAAGP